MNRLSWLLVVTSVTALGIGCQSAKFPTPKWPKMAMFKEPPSLFKKKEKDIGPPSEHFDATMDQVASGADAKKIQTDIPGEGSTKRPSETAKPTGTLASNTKAKPETNNKSNETASAKSGEKKPFQLTPAAPTDFETPEVGESLADGKRPIRKPYANPEADSLNKAAEKLAQDWDRKAEPKNSEMNAQANSNGQFQSPLKPPPAFNPSRSTEIGSNQLTPKSPSETGITTTMPSGNGGGAFVFGAAAAATAKDNAIPPWTSVSKNENQPNQRQTPTDQGFPPAESSPVNSNANALNSPWPGPNSGSSQAKPIQGMFEPRNNSEIGNASPSSTVNHDGANLGNPKIPSHPNGNVFSPNVSTNQNPIALSTPGKTGANSLDGQNYPSTKFPAFPAGGSQGPTNSNLAATPPAAKINEAWATQPTSVISPDRSNGPTKNQTVGLTAELPAELLKRSGTYAPGSTRTAPADGVIRR